MNILEATLQQDTLRLPSGHYFKTTLPLPKTEQGKAVKIGIRPEKITLSTVQPESENHFLLPISVVEDLGAQRVIHCELGSQPLLIVTELNNLVAGDSIYISVAMQDLYLFDAQDGNAFYADQE